jgi:competence protein ComEC
MRKRWILPLLVLFCFMFAVPAMAAPTVILDGQQLTFADTEPIIEDGRTLVPLRAIFEAMGATVSWDDSTKTATAIKGDTTVTLKIGSTTPTINGRVKDLDVPAKIVSGRTLAPLRFVGEAFGSEIEWEQGSQTIRIFSKPPSGTPPPTAVKSNEIKVHFIDVGQGDSILIQPPSGSNILIDAGEDSAPVIEYLKKHNVNYLAAVIATHPHSDHIGGMADVIKTFNIGSFYMPNITHTTKAFENMLDALSKKQNTMVKQVSTEVPVDGNVFDGGIGYAAYFVAPNLDTYDNLNDYSAVLKVMFGDTVFLFTGDAEAVSEAEMVGKQPIKADLLKVGHHGSDTSTTERFLNAVKPQFAVISVGDNNYGHPSDKVIARLQTAGVKVYRTDKQGTIVATSDGNSISINTAPIDKISPPITLPVIKDPVLKENYIGNKNSKKFHAPTCKTLPAEKNRIYFETRDEAVNQGYAPCGNCKP